MKAAAAQLDVSLTEEAFVSALLRFEWLVAPRYARWVRRGVALGAACGVLAYLALLWSFDAWPGRFNPYAGEAFSYRVLLLGFPFSLLAVQAVPLGETVTYVAIGVSIALAWAVLGGVLAGIGSAIYFRVRST